MDKKTKMPDYKARANTNYLQSEKGKIATRKYKDKLSSISISKQAKESLDKSKQDSESLSDVIMRLTNNSQ